MKLREVRARMTERLFEVQETWDALNAVRHTRADGGATGRDLVDEQLARQLAERIELFREELARAGKVLNEVLLLDALHDYAKAGDLVNLTAQPGSMGLPPVTGEAMADAVLAKLGEDAALDRKDTFTRALELLGRATD